MPELLLTVVEYGNYISPVKLVVFLVLFFLWLPLVNWVFEDARKVGTKDLFWTAVVLAAGAGGILLWLLIPIFIVGLLIYVAAVAAAALSYVSHRNAIVLDFDRVLTTDHIKNLFAGNKKELEKLKKFVFITANGNEIPVPEPKTPDFLGYRAAYEILSDATWRRASQITFSPTGQNYQITYDVDGAALKQPEKAKDRTDYFIRFVKKLADLDPDEKRKPQKGTFKTRQNEQNTQWELSAAGSTVGEQIQLKQASQQNITRLNQLNLPSEQYEQLKALTGQKQGVFIVSGPKKSGVTSTFYSLLRSHDAFINSINTLEKQPTSELPNITQEVYSLSDTGVTTFAKKLQGLIRMGPDIVGVADCRDAETARVVTIAVRDGKLVYVVIQADSTLQALSRWMKWVNNKNLAADMLLGISNQRLLRKLCEQCKQAYQPNQELLRKFNLPAEKARVLYREGKVQYDKHGKPVTCEHCQGTGFRGRLPIFEMVTINDQLRKALKQLKSLSDIGRELRRAKMLYLQEQALKNVMEGSTSINEMIRILSLGKKKKTKSTQPQNPDRPQTSSQPSKLEKL